MTAANRLAVAGDPDLEDLYLCEIVKEADHLTPNPLVRVLRILRYPIQHAIMLPDVPNENAPVGEGVVCRLTEAPGVRPEAPDGSYAESLRRAQEEYLNRAPPDEAEIIRRHMRGEFLKKRVVIRK